MRLLACLLAAALSLPAHAAEPAARVVAVRGEVTARAPDDTVRALVAGLPLHAGDRITTGADSGVRLAFTDESVLLLGAHSELTIERYRTRAEDAAFVLGVAKGVSGS